MTRLPIRFRLTAGFAAAMLAVLTLAGALTYLRVASVLTETLDEGLGSRADDIAALVESGNGRPRLPEAQRLVESGESFSQVLLGNGSIVEDRGARGERAAASSLAPRVGPAISPIEAARASRHSVNFGDRPITGIEGRARIFARPVQAGGRTLVVVVGVTTANRQEVLHSLRTGFSIGGPVAVLLASALGFVLAGRAMGPVEAMRRRAADVTLDRSGERLPLPDANDEIRRLGATLNVMLDRIESSLDRERVFAADASHELRTPLAILRTELELAQRPGRSPEELRTALRSTGEEVDRLSRLAEDLLVIARTDQGRLPIRRRPTDMRELLESIRDRFSGSAAELGRELTVDKAQGTANLDRERMEQALGNLVDNALRHGRGHVRLRGIAAGEGAELSVSDEGAGFTEEFAPEAFERFSRADPGRSGGGSGLGLAIARTIAHAHGGDATIEPGPSGLSVVRISFPVP